MDSTIEVTGEVLGESLVDTDVTRTVKTDDHEVFQDFRTTIYKELRALAAARMRHLQPGQTLQPTALVHELYLRMKRRKTVVWDNRAHFFGAAARAMRDILVEHARRRGAQKRGGHLVRVDITMSVADTDKTLAAADILTVHAALGRMQQEYPDHANLVLLYYFAGLSMREVAEVQNVAPRTVQRRWRFARAWLQARIGTR